MAAELTKAEQNALCASYDVMGTHVELDLPFVKKYLVRGRSELVSDQEIVFFMNTCKQLKLNPTVGGEIYLIKYSKDDPAQVVIGKDTYMRRAWEHPNYLFKEDGIVVQRGNQIIQKEGCCLYPGEALIGGWCRVHFMRQDVERTAFKEVAFSEYNKGMANWKSKPATMINKVAISQCVREAFPKDYEGVYSEDEMIASGAIPATAIDTEPVGPAADNTPDDPEISQEQRQQLFRTAKEHFGASGNDVLKEILADHGRDSTVKMPVSIFAEVMGDLLKRSLDSKNVNQETGEVTDIEQSDE